MSRPPRMPVQPLREDPDAVDASPSATRAHLFIGNVSPDADERYLERLFAVYGPVEKVTLGGAARETGPNSVEATHAVVHMKYADDADCAVAALQLRYCMCMNLPVIVLYAKSSPTVTRYGRAVGEHYRRCLDAGKPPTPLPLETFDAALERTPEPLPPTDFTLPTVAPGVAAAAAAAAAAVQHQPFFGAPTMWGPAFTGNSGGVSRGGGYR